MKRVRMTGAEAYDNRRKQLVTVKRSRETGDVARNVDDKRAGRTDEGQYEMVGGERATLKKPSKVSTPSFGTVQTQIISPRQVASPRRTNHSCDSSRVTRLSRPPSINLFEKP